MDSAESFCEFMQPRNSPQPTSFHIESSDRAIPEVSLMFEKPHSHQSSYNYWKLHSNQKVIPASTVFSNENVPSGQSVVNPSNSFLKKQVRFQSYSPKNQAIKTPSAYNYNCESNSMRLSPPRSNHRFNPQHSDLGPSKIHFMRPELELSQLEPRPPLKSIPEPQEIVNMKSLNLHERAHFELPSDKEIHRGSINTVIVPFKEKIKEPRPESLKPKTYKEWLVQNANKLNEKQSKPSDEQAPTVGDLYKIIQEQNSHLIALQKQVDLLLNQSNHAEKEPPTNHDRCPVSVCSTCNIKKKADHSGPVQMSIGVMTSFEFNLKSVHREQSTSLADSDVNPHVSHPLCDRSEILTNNSQKHCQILPKISKSNSITFQETSDNNKASDKAHQTVNAIAKPANYENYSRRIEPINNDKRLKQVVESTTKEVLHQTPITSKPANIRREAAFQRTQEKLSYSVNSSDMTGRLNPNNDYSLFEIPEIPEPLDVTPSPSSSIRVEMQEFSDSDESIEEVENSEQHENNIGWTIYNNVVGQVKNILEQSPIENENPQERNIRNNKLLENVKQATINQLHNFGINITEMSPMNIDENVATHVPICSGDLSIEVNQLVMKYLRDDQLSMLISKGNFFQHGKDKFQRTPNSSPIPHHIGQENISNEISIATINYMQKYQLWDQGTKRNGQQFVRERKRGTPKYFTKRQISQNKILDITALKQQPKLL